MHNCIKLHTNVDENGGGSMDLKIARLKKRMTQEELARKSRVSRNLISKAENGDISKMSVEKMERISEVLKISVKRLFF